MNARARAMALCLAAGIGVSACAGDGGYGYSGVAMGVGPVDPYWGWYGDWYYPGYGGYVYDRGGAGRRWNRGEHHYWSGRTRGGPHRGGMHWEGYNGGSPPAHFHGGGGHRGGGGHHR